jgi:hypothetical protein
MYLIRSCYSEGLDSLKCSVSKYVQYKVRGVYTPWNNIEKNTRKNSNAFCYRQVWANMQREERVRERKWGRASSLTQLNWTGGFWIQVRRQQKDCGASFYNIFSLKGTSTSSNIQVQVTLITVLTWEWVIVTGSKSSMSTVTLCLCEKCRYLTCSWIRRLKHWVSLIQFVTLQNSHLQMTNNSTNIIISSFCWCLFCKPKGERKVPAHPPNKKMFAQFILFFQLAKAEQRPLRTSQMRRGGVLRLDRGIRL